MAIPSGRGNAVANRAETITLTDVPHDDELKQGWEVAARIECELPTHTRFWMKLS
jgi:hypothetical protein